MKKEAIIMMIAAAAVTIASCTADENLPGGGQGDAHPVLDVLGAAIAPTEAATRAVGTTTVTSGSIGVFLSNTDPADTDPPYVPVSNRKYTYGTPKWTTDKAIYLGGEEAKVCAYYPYSATQATTAVALTTQGYAAGKDLSYAPCVKVNGGPDKTIDGDVGRHVTFVLKRAYSRAKVEFTRKNYTGTGTVTEIKWQKLPLSATLGIADGTYTALTAGEKVQTVSYTLPATDALTVKEADELLIAPGKIAEPTAGDKDGLVLVLTIDNKPMTTYLKPSALSELKAGKYYTFKVNVNGTGIDIAKVELEDWQAQTIEDTGNKPFETEPEPQP